MKRHGIKFQRQGRVFFLKLFVLTTTRQSYIYNILTCFMDTLYFFFLLLSFFLVIVHLKVQMANVLILPHQPTHPLNVGLEVVH